MEKQNKPKKNHWTQSKVDEWAKKINQEIYKRNRQAPIHLKMDDLAILINDKITRRGIAKGLVFIQEDLNSNLNKKNLNFFWKKCWLKNKFMLLYICTKEIS